jgi:hypothetical protein
MKYRFAPPARKILDDEEEDQEDVKPEDELKVEPRTRSLDPSDPYIPRCPTTGWLLSELERNGKSFRGQPGILKKRSMLVAELRKLGYDVYAGGSEAKAPKEDR